MLKIYKFLKPYTGQIILMVLLLCLQVFTMLFLPNLMSEIVNVGIVQRGGDVPYILSQGGIMLLVALVSSICAVSVGYLASKIAVSFATDVRGKMFDCVEQFTMNEFDKLGTASLTTRATNDVTQVQDFTIMMFRIMVLAPLMCIGGIAMAVSKNPRLSWVIVAAMPVVLLFIIILFKKVIPIFRSVQKKLDNLNLVMRESLTGVRVIRAFTADKREQQRFDAANETLTQASIRSQILLSSMMPFLMLIINIANVFVIWFGGQNIAAGAMQVGDVMAFLQYLMQIMMALVMMSLVFVMLPRASVCANRINEVLQTEVSIKSPKNPETTEKDTGVIEFKNVSFKYAGADNMAIEDISFTAKPGEFTAIMGGTGSGKSTIIQLIPRLYDVTEGSITLNGIDIRKYNTDDLRSRIGYCPQKAMLLSGTIESNVAFGKENATDEEIAGAAEIAQSIDFIKKKEKGFKDPIAQGGTNVSGGQKQRLSIARALCTNANIYIFDDSFSALDFKTDAALRSALRRETSGATVIIVAQRINTVMDADKIILLNNGKIVGVGKHEELLETCEEYAEIAKSQLG